MKKNAVVFLFALCPLVPATARFAYGIILCLATCWYFFTGILFRTLVKKINVGEAGPYIELVCLASSATLFYLVLQGFFPILSVSLGLYVFISAFSYLLLIGIESFSTDTVSTNPLIPFIPVLVFFSAIREILGFGTLSIPVPAGLHEIVIFHEFATWGLGFWSTSGGALILLGFLAWFFKYVNRRISSFRRNA